MSLSDDQLDAQAAFLDASAPDLTTQEAAKAAVELEVNRLLSLYGAAAANTLNGMSADARFFQGLELVAERNVLSTTAQNLARSASRETDALRRLALNQMANQVTQRAVALEAAFTNLVGAAGTVFSDAVESFFSAAGKDFLGPIAGLGLGGYFFRLKLNDELDRVIATGGRRSSSSDDNCGARY